MTTNDAPLLREHLDCDSHDDHATHTEHTRMCGRCDKLTTSCDVVPTRCFFCNASIWREPEPRLLPPQKAGPESLDIRVEKVAGETVDHPDGSCPNGRERVATARRRATERSEASMRWLQFHQGRSTP